MQIRNIPFIAILGLGIGASLASCRGTEPDPEHCWHSYGDATCAERFPDGDRPFCTNPTCDPESEGHYGCVAERPVDDECYSPCGGDQSILEDSSCPGISDDESGTGTAETTADTEDTTESGPETGPLPCMGPEDCMDEAAPFCGDQGECVACDGTAEPDAACAGLDAANPVCEAGACVQCADGKVDACMGTTPICDLEQNACVACSDHDECPLSACNLDLGNCMDPAAVVHVDGDGGQDFTTLTAALNANGGVTELTIILHDANYAPESVSIADNDYVAILAAPGESPTIQGTSGNPAFDVTMASTLYLRGVSAANTAGGGPGLDVASATAYVQECRIVNNAGGGIVVDSASGTLYVENSFVGGSSSNPAIEVSSGTAQVVYSTLALPPAIGSPTLECVEGMNVTVRNSIITSTNAQAEVACPNVTITGSALEMAMGDNVALGDVNVDWFEDYLGGDFHLVDGMYPEEIESAATWLPGDPTTDIDGDARPTTEGPDFAGADRIP